MVWIEKFVKANIVRRIYAFILQYMGENVSCLLFNSETIREIHAQNIIFPLCDVIFDEIYFFLGCLKQSIFKMQRTIQFRHEACDRQGEKKKTEDRVG